MVSVFVSLGVGLVVFAGVALWVGALAAILPAVISSGITFFVIARKIGKTVQVQMEGIVPMLERRDVKGAKAHLRGVQKQWGRWQPFLGGQIEMQLGMIDYIQRKWDAALPQLEKGSFRNWTALLCIGAIHWRKKDKSKAIEYFKKAESASKKEPMVYTVWSVLLTRDGKRDDALAVLSRGRKQLPDNGVLKGVHDRIRNKKKIDVSKLPQNWYQFFPEEMSQQHRMRGRNGPYPGANFPQPKVNRQQRRGR